LPCQAVHLRLRHPVEGHGVGRFDAFGFLGLNGLLQTHHLQGWRLLFGALHPSVGIGQIDERRVDFRNASQLRRLLSGELTIGHLLCG